MSKAKEPTKGFKSTSGQPERIALTTGHVTVVPAHEFRQIEKRYWSHAYALGCESEDMSDAPTTHAPDSLEARKQTIMRAIDAMVREGEADPVAKAKNFTKEGAPDTNVLQQRSRLTIKAQERDLLWEEYQADPKSATGRPDSVEIEEDDLDDDNIKD